MCALPALLEGRGDGLRDFYVRSGGRRNVLLRLFASLLLAVLELEVTRLVGARLDEVCYK